MFERFTDRARKVMALANQEARQFNHEYIGTEHILLGLVREGSGVGANVLKNLGVPLPIARREVEKLIQRGPEIVSTGKLPLTPRAKRVIEHAAEEALKLGHNYVGTEHLLLGLLREQEGLAAQALINLELKLEQVRDEVINLLGTGSAAAPQPTGPPDADVAEPPPTPVSPPADPWSAVPEKFKTHPLVVHYVALIVALSREVETCVKGQDEQWAREIGMQRNGLHGQLRRLVGWLEVDPNFGLAREA